MPLNVGRLADLMELYAGRGGVNRDKIPRKLLKEVINFKLKEFARRTGVVASKVTRSSVANVQEYEQVDCDLLSEYPFELKYSLESSNDFPYI